MPWFVAYCLASFGFFVLGAKGLSLHWFWNSVFSLLASATLIYAMHRIVRARLCRRRLTKAFKRGADIFDIRTILEGAFSRRPDLSDPSDAWCTGFFAYLPISIIVFVCLRLLLHSTSWRAVIALASAVPMAVVVGKVVNRLSAQRRMLFRARKAIVDHDPGMWDEILCAWAFEQPFGRPLAPHQMATADELTAAREEREAIESGTSLRCNNCGARQHKGEWEEAMDAHARAMGSAGFVNLSARPECLKCGSTDLVEASQPRAGTERPSEDVSTLAEGFRRAGRKWAEAHSREQQSVSLSSDGFRGVLASTRPVKEEAEKEVQRLIGEARAEGILDDVLLLLQRKGEKAALYLINGYL